MRQMLDSVIGNSLLKSKLLSDILSDTLSHAYIIEGKKGSGRHTIAYMTAAALVCEKINDNASPLPCLNCPSCKKILGQKSPDVITVTREDKATLGVDAIRFLRNDVRVVPNDLDYKIYVIEDADTMTPQAQNAFLLTLEEPPEYVKFFLLCEDSKSFLETIISRAQLLRTELIAATDIDDFLQNNHTEAKKMKLSDPDSYNELIMASENSIGRAIELLDNKSLKKTLEHRLLARDFLKIISTSGDSEKIVSLLSQFEKKRDGVLEQLTIIEAALRDIIAIDRTENAPLVFFYDRQEALLISDSINIRKLIHVYDKLKDTEDMISQNANVRLSLTSFFSEINII